MGLVRHRNKMCYHLSKALVPVQATLAAPPRTPRRPNRARRNVRRPDRAHAGRSSSGDAKAPCVYGPTGARGDEERLFSATDWLYPALSLLIDL